MSLTIAVIFGVSAVAVDFFAIQYLKNKYEKEKLGGTPAVSPEEYGFPEFLKWVAVAILGGFFIFDRGDELYFGGFLAVVVALHCFAFNKELEEKNKTT